MFTHFGQRLKRDLKQLVDRRIQASETASGGIARSTGVEVDVISHKRQRYAVWFGGSLLASLVSLNSFHLLNISFSHEFVVIARILSILSH